MSNNRLQESIQNRDEWIAYLATKSHKRLAKRLDIIRQQMDMARDQNKPDELELLFEWELQTITARLLKTENDIADVPTEMELELARQDELLAQEEDVIELTAKRTLELDKLQQPKHIEEKGTEETNNDIQEDDKDEQLSLF